ncbi:MAG: hypothetical protein CVU49_01695 [Candidatus Cloacimonetes bacterium HGW-Cloacimonetes-2]|jgi:GNAT superfamily N-acetyltransferase|nr:MAG: hypothetical protein CVU49_01695 [Candidatus Cloacimonetes bacterium HGW-Cloacimonetes-2]
MSIDQFTQAFVKTKLLTRIRRNPDCDFQEIMMSFDLRECIVRLARTGDTRDLLAISKTIWDGTDYLPEVIEEWIKERWLFVAEFHGKVLACIKLSQFPDNVIWIEGLRVHARYQGKGIGTLLNDYIMDYAYRLKEKNRSLSFEFCTYYKNFESLKMTEKLGFNLVESFYSLDHHKEPGYLVPEIVEDYGMDIFDNYPSYIPLGWQSVRNKPESLDFIKRNATVFRTPQSIYLIGGKGEKAVTFLKPPTKDLAAELPYFGYFFRRKRRIGIVCSTGFDKQLPYLLDSGFFFWDESREVAANMLIKRLG